MPQISEANNLSIESHAQKQEAHAINQTEEKKSMGFRIKKAINIAFITLASVFGAMVVGAGIATAVCNPPGAAVVTIVAASILLGVVSLKLLQLALPHLPNWLRVPVNYVRSFVCGLASIVALGILFPVNLEKRNPTKEQCDPNQTPVLMIHGFLGSSNNWIYHRNRLKEAGFKNIFTVNLGNPFNSIETYAERVHKMVEEIKEKTGRTDLQIVCHSMGGLVAREYNQKYAEKDGVTVKDIVTLGTPLDGTRVAWMTMGMSKAGKQMFPQSEFVRKQQANALTMNPETHHYHIASKCDYVIRPLVSAAMGFAPNTTVDWLSGTSHVSYLFSDTAADRTIEYLKRRRDSDQAAASA